MEARRLRVKDFVELMMLILIVAGLVWRGGQIVQEVSTISHTLDTLQVTMQTRSDQISSINADIRVMQASNTTYMNRLDNDEKRIANHETRIQRLENRSGMRRTE